MYIAHINDIIEGSVVGASVFIITTYAHNYAYLQFSRQVNFTVFISNLSSMKLKFNNHNTCEAQVVIIINNQS